MSALTHAEKLLQELGITTPEEIDLDAIAFHVGAFVRFRHLDGCEARIIGRDSQAIITVNSHSHPRRKRFSIAHELGHWHFHRGKSLVCRVDDLQPHPSHSPERVADAYAADLLMPRYIFGPLARRQDKLSFKVVTAFADMFNTSLTATAIRFVDGDYMPSILVCHGPNGRKWFTSAPSVPKRWFPRDLLDAESFAFGILFGNNLDDSMPRRIGAEAWFDKWEAERFEIQEQTIRTAPNEVLTLLIINDPEMLEDQDGGGKFRSR